MMFISQSAKILALLLHSLIFFFYLLASMGPRFSLAAHLPITTERAVHRSSSASSKTRNRRPPPPPENATHQQ
jgi:hypothetical protein